MILLRIILEHFPSELSDEIVFGIVLPDLGFYCSIFLEVYPSEFSLGLSLISFLKNLPWDFPSECYLGFPLSIVLRNVLQDVLLKLSLGCSLPCVLNVFLTYIS